MEDDADPLLGHVNRLLELLELAGGLMERLGMRKPGELDHPSLPEGHPLRHHVVYEVAAPNLPSPKT
jgi:hypothetical protein